MVVFGYQELAVFVVLFFLIGIGTGHRWVDQPRKERLQPCLRISRSVTAILLPLYAIGLVTWLIDGGGLKGLVEMTFGMLRFGAVVFLTFGLPFTIGALLWPQRRRPGAPGESTGLRNSA